MALLPSASNSNNIIDPLEYLDSSRYSVIYDELRNYFQENKIEVPQMGEKNEKLVERFRDSIKTYFQTKLNLSATKHYPLEVQERLDTVISDMCDLMQGFGPLQKFLRLDTIEEIIVRNGSILTEQNGRIRVEEDNSNDPDRRRILDSQFTILAKRIADLGRNTISETQPFAVTVIPDTLDRFAVIIPPLAHEYVAINIRVFPKSKAYTLNDLQKRGAFADKKTFEGSKVGQLQKKRVQYDAFIQDYIELKRREVKKRRESDPPTEQEIMYNLGRKTSFRKLIDSIPDDNAKKDFEKISKDIGAKIAMFLGYVAYLNLSTVLMAGEFSSGKTTILNAMSYFIRENVSPITIEEYLELKIQHKYGLRLVTYKKIDQGVVLNQVITRMRPDLIIVGELVEKGQSFEFLNASNFGKKAWSTIPSNNAYAALIRLENLSTIEGYTPFEIRRRIVNSVDMVVHVAQESGQRFVNEIALVQPKLSDKGDYILKPLYKSGRRGSRLDMLQALWAGLSEQD